MVLDVDFDVFVILQVQGLCLFDCVIGLLWQLSGYELIGLDGICYCFDMCGQVLSVCFVDGQQWLVLDVGVVFVGSNDLGECFVIECDSQGCIECVIGCQVDGIDVFIVYCYDGQGCLILVCSFYGVGGLNENIGYYVDGSVIGEFIIVQFGMVVGWLVGVVVLINCWSGNFDVVMLVCFSFVVCDSEIVSMIKMQGGVGVVIYVVEMMVGGSLVVEGVIVFGWVSNGGKIIMLICVIELGFKLLVLSGSGVVELKIMLVGDLNCDGKVDGVDLVVFVVMGVDLNGDGVISDSDCQIFYVNYGWCVNQVLVGMLDSVLVLMYIDLGKVLGFEDVVIDVEGDVLFWCVLFIIYGSVWFMVDGCMLEFMFEVGYVGFVDVMFQVDDGYLVFLLIKVNFNVSGVKLIVFYVDWLVMLILGQMCVFQVLGDFEDQFGVVLMLGYVSFSVIDGMVVGVDVQGFVYGLKVGSSIVSIQVCGIEVVNVILVMMDGFGFFLDIDGFEVGVYLWVIMLVQNGLCQFKVLLFDYIDILVGLIGMCYFIVDLMLVEVLVDGLIWVLKIGEMIIFVVYNGM